MQSDEADEVRVFFPRLNDALYCELAELSPTKPPALPGGFGVGETVYYLKKSQTFASGNRIVYGGEGTVVGPNGDPDKVVVEFHADGDAKSGKKPCTINCKVSSLGREPPALPGGYGRGDAAHYTARSETLSNGEELLYAPRPRPRPCPRPPPPPPPLAGPSAGMARWAQWWAQASTGAPRRCSSASPRRPRR